MKLRFLAFSVTLLLSTAVRAQSPKHELRAAWFTTFLNLDWPSTSGRTVQQVQDSVIRILDLYRQTGINAVYFQVRSECDALYPSNLEPWSAAVTGTQGVAPAGGFNPLQFVIDECRKRGIEIHAWFNPFRAVNNFNNINNYAASHIAKTRPDWLLAQGTLRILDPGIPDVRDYVIRVVMEVVRSYDVDGVHFDDYFYPYPSAGGSPTPPRFNDDATFAADPRGFADRNNWRRDNINLVIQRTNDSIRSAKPWVKFGISPFGIWRNQGSDPAGSATNGLQSFSDVFADSRKWIQEEWVDYLTPQLYWSIGFSVANYSVLVPWWNQYGTTRHLYAGQAAYKVGADADANWNNPSQINNQVRLNRQNNRFRGSTFFRTRNLALNPLQFRDSLVQHVYTRPALLPTMPWRDAHPPQPVSNLTAQVTAGSVTLNWTAPPAATDELDRVRQYAVYRSVSPSVDLSDARNLLAITPNAGQTSFTDQPETTGTYFYTVTSLDRFHNESEAGNTVEVNLLTTSLVSPDLQALNLQVFPNPAPLRGTVTLLFELQQAQQVELLLLDVAGRQLRTIRQRLFYPGKQTIQVPTTDLPGGLYYLVLRSSRFSHTTTLVLQ
ncbi:MAG TPA: family 10 glycosylhydrolase [Lacibacter sp.]|nr:family 10 glycosylhydrolase [Lacibacter sp.]HMO89412.1 family 10 glycosylhydrolase [Lacibacter sp.]